MTDAVREGRRLAWRVRHLGVPGYGTDEVCFLAAVLVRARPTHVFEWGTNVGASARIFWEAGQLLALRLEVHTVELPVEEAWRDPDHPGDRLARQIRDVPVARYLGDGLETALRLCAKLAPARPLFFVDGDHRWESVLRELRGLAPLESPIVLHDSRQLEGVARAIDDFLFEPAGRAFRREDLRSHAGMTALWPST